MNLTRFVLEPGRSGAVEDVLELALSGDVDAQYAAGLIYAEGRGVEIDLVQAYYWLTRAVEHGNEDAEKFRLQVGVRMNDEEYDRAVHLIEVASEDFVRLGLDPDMERVIH